jgi:Ni/Fe-hydrogenase subunit HybB-like protein
VQAIAALVLLAVLAVAGWLLDARALLAAYLGAWWFVAGALLGGLVNVWLHQLTGGDWGEVIRPPLLRAARWLPLACILYLPALLCMHRLYPWANVAGGTSPVVGFQQWWLQPGFFIARGIVYLLVWSGLGVIETRARRRSPGRAAACLLVWVFSVSLAGVDWIMSLHTEWYSSVFGWLLAVGQMLSGLALAMLLIDRQAARKQLPDFGNLLLSYVMSWGYLSYVQFLIIWAADLPHEISWYLLRSVAPWRVVAWVLVLSQLAIPLCLLLSRKAKQGPRMVGLLAAWLLAAHLLDCWWLVLPSVRGLSHNWMWLAPLAALGLGLLAWSAIKERVHA